MIGEIGEIAEKIRNLRKRKNWTLKELSERTGLSVSFLSQVENGTSSLAITSLKKISDAFNVSINYFFKSPEIHNFLIKKEDQSPFKIDGCNSELVRLSGDFSNRTLESLLVTIPPEEQHGNKSTHPGEEFVMVLEGALIVNINGTEYLAKAGDTLHYPSTIMHTWFNPLKEETKILCIITPVLF